jgi:PmbA protein
MSRAPGSAPGFRAPVDPDRALAILDEAVSGAAADQVDVCLLGRAGEYTRFAGGRIHQPQDITEVQFLIRAIVDGHAARVATSAPDEVAGAVGSAAAMARGLARAAGRPGGATVAGERPGGQPPADWLWHADTVAFDEQQRVATVRAAHAAAAEHGGTVAGMVGRAVTQLAVASSLGVRRSTLATEALGGFTFVVGDGSAHFLDLGRSAGRLRLAEAVSQTAAQAAVSVGRRELAPGEYTVVLGPEATAELLEFLPDLGFSGELAAHGVGVCASRSGQQLASPLVTVADDAGSEFGLPIGFDLEGVPKRRVPFFTAGQVGEPVTDLHTAALLGTTATGHAHIAREQVPEPKAANIVMSAGASTEAELVAGVAHGVYLQRFWYTRLVDRVAGTITGVTRDACFEIRDGVLTAPLTGMRFTQSVLDLLATVDGVGDRVRSAPVMNVWNSATTAPAIRAHGFRLGARPAPREATVS